MRHLILGNSAAGIFAAEAIRKHDPVAEITILSDEKYPVYSRCLLTYYLAGDCGEEQLSIRDADYYQKMDIRFRPGEKAIRIEPEKKCVYTLSERKYEYDRLLIATGAGPEVPFIPGGACRAVFNGLRTLNDAKSMLRYAQPGKHAVILGAGQVSLKTAYGLRKQGMDVTVLSASSQIFSQALDEYAAGLVEGHLTRHGIRFLKQKDVNEIQSFDDTVCAVKTSDGDVLPADLVVIGKGVRPNVDCIRGSGIHIDFGVIVDSQLRTNIPDIFAAGDVIETFDLARLCQRVNAIWPNATEQGRIAGLNMLGGKIEYRGSIAMNSTELFGFSAISGGFARGEEPEYEVRRYISVDGSYRRLVFKDDLLVGYILAGETGNAGLLTAIIREGKRLGNRKEKLINSGKIFYSLFYHHQHPVVS
ncbi:MAG: NAD(P)/FAD-dependent oxidoreductase [Clostridiales bacterium]|jgi:NAD(P)H-nitrite reductase large subunit|nr:NAD(P)/FAD-dependent oxidoreductase [Clostridiales bacterium]